MSREITNVLSTGLDIYNCVICLFMIFSLTQSLHKDKSTTYFILAAAGVLVFNMADISNWCFEGMTPAWRIPALHILTFVYYFIVPFNFLFLIKYIITYVPEKKSNNVLFNVCVGLSAAYLVGLFISPFNGFYYYITEDNHYARGDYNYISVGFNACFYAISTIIIIANRKGLSRKAFWSFMSFPFLPITTELIQLRFYGLSLVNTGMTCSLLMIFMNLHRTLEFSYEKSTNEIRKKEKKLISIQEHTIVSLSNLVENRDTETGEHAKRTSMFVELLARKTFSDGYYPEILNDEYISLLAKATPMHDIGKIVVSDTVLKKAGKLNETEFEQMKLHAEEGGRIVNDIIGISDNKLYIQIAVDMAQSHHERWDGTGYPNKLFQEEIPLCARIMAVADVFDALVFERCYKKPIPPEDAFEIIKTESGTHFDPILVQEFLAVKDDVLDIIDKFGN